MRRVAAVSVLLPLVFGLAAARQEQDQSRPRATAQRQGQQSQSQRAADDDEVIRVETHLVTVPVAVRDAEGRFLPGLRREQFRLFEDGAEQEIAFFESADKPVTVALVLDISDSAHFKRAEIAAAARAFAAELRADDRVRLVAFDKHVHTLAEATGDRSSVEAAINRLRSGGGTSLYDAVSQTLGALAGRARGRKAVILFTDGIDTTSRLSAHDTVRDAEESDALVYAVQYNTVQDAVVGQSVAIPTTPKGEPVTAAFKRGNLYLRLLADRTGGRFYQADSVKHLSQSFKRIAAELREQYSIGYYPKAREGGARVRKIKVRVDAPGARVRARERYIFNPERGARGRVRRPEPVARAARG